MTGVFPEPPTVIFPIHTTGIGIFSHNPLTNLNLVTTSQILLKGLRVYKMGLISFLFLNQNFGVFIIKKKPFLNYLITCNCHIIY